MAFLCKTWLEVDVLFGVCNPADRMIMTECLYFVCTLNRLKERHLESIGHILNQGLLAHLI